MAQVPVDSPRPEGHRLTGALSLAMLVKDTAVDTHTGNTETGFRFALFSRVIEKEGEKICYRMLMHDLPRRFQRQTAELQVPALRAPAPLAIRRCDALLAAVTEQITRLHGHGEPDWVEESARFLDMPRAISTLPTTAMDSELCAPGALIRPGAFPDPPDLDAREGDRHACVP